jgi:hypothetical protein
MAPQYSCPGLAGGEGDRLAGLGDGDVDPQGAVEGVIDGLAHRAPAVAVGAQQVIGQRDDGLAVVRVVVMIWRRGLLAGRG